MNKIGKIYVYLALLYLSGLLIIACGHNVASTEGKAKYVAVPEYQFVSNSILKEIKRNTAWNEIHRFDMCYTDSAVYLWDSSGTQIIDSLNLVCVSHTKGMAYERDSLFPYLLKGIVKSGLYTFYFYDDCTIERLLKPTKRTRYIRISITDRTDYITIAGGMESEMEFYLYNSNDLRKISSQIIVENECYADYFICSEDFESKDRFRSEVDTAALDLSKIALYPTIDRAWDYQRSEDALNAFITQNVQWLPGSDTVFPRKVNVIVVIERDGSISECNCLLEKGDCWDQEALRIVQKFPLFMPAHKQGKAIRTEREIVFDFPNIYKNR